jgi:uncharacterized membrane protein
MKITHPVVHGHPLHAMSSDLPVALIPFALLASIALGRRGAAMATQAAAASALGAVLLGWWDWLTIPRDHPAWRPATLHGLINTTVLGAVILGLFSRERRALALGTATAALSVSAWIGGDLVYRLGWRVRPAEELELIEQGNTRETARRIVDDHEREDTLFP